ncbi:hypothetical protein FKM82_002611 [Ascaphus truei]
MRSRSHAHPHVYAFLQLVNILYPVLVPNRIQTCLRLPYKNPRCIVRGPESYLAVSMLVFCFLLPMSTFRQHRSCL